MAMKYVGATEKGKKAIYSYQPFVRLNQVVERGKGR
jgi:hypothetical protein